MSDKRLIVPMVVALQYAINRMMFTMIFVFVVLFLLANWLCPQENSEKRSEKLQAEEEIHGPRNP